MYKLTPRVFLLGFLSSCLAPISDFVPPALVDSWKSSNKNDTDIYTFLEKGNYQHTNVHKEKLEKCIKTETLTETGSVKVTEKQILFYPISATLKIDNNCIKPNNYEKSNVLKPYTCGWRLEVGSYQQQDRLWLKFPDGHSNTYTRNHAESAFIK